MDVAGAFVEAFVESRGVKSPHILNFSRSSGTCVKVEEPIQLPVSGKSTEVEDLGQNRVQVL